MATVAIITNKKKDTDGLVTQKCVEILKEQFKILCCDGTDAVETERILGMADAAIIIGGDGTILSAAYSAASNGVPLLGINMGHMGFLADVEPSELEVALDAFVNGRYRVEERFMLRAFLKNSDGRETQLTALNDLVITRASYTRMVALDVWVDGYYAASYVGDGVVIATPTGSTAYSLSAGGPVVDPSLEVAVITPVCPHTMSSKPLIVPGNAEITVRFKNTFDDISMITSDGQRGMEISNGDTVTVKAAPCKTGLIKISDRCFYEILHQKLHG